MKCLPRCASAFALCVRSDGAESVTIRPSDMHAITNSKSERGSGRELHTHIDAIAAQYILVLGPASLELHPDRRRHRLRRVGRGLRVIIISFGGGGVFRAHLRLVDVLELHGF